MNALTQELVELLTLEKLEENIYRGISRNLVGKRVLEVRFSVKHYVLLLTQLIVLRILCMPTFYMVVILMLQSSMK